MSVKNCKVLDILEKKKMPQKTLAEKLNMPKGQMNDYCRNRKIMSLSTARKVAKELQVTIDDLYEWDD